MRFRIQFLFPNFRFKTFLFAAAYFFAGNTKSPSNAGFRIRDENGSGDVIRRYRKEGVTITLPEGKSLNNIKWFSVWCEEFEVNIFIV